MVLVLNPMSSAPRGLGTAQRQLPVESNRSVVYIESDHVYLCRSLVPLPSSVSRFEFCLQFELRFLSFDTPLSVVPSMFAPHCLVVIALGGLAASLPNKLLPYCPECKLDPCLVELIAVDIPNLAIPLSRCQSFLQTTVTSTTV